ncbi:hypothetical protein JB92DRAFT_2985149 [Gautieria morchelliformis]|nr:hypothetical protein JB92DRAFT_2985149 [Gautieria morchelliformis]
MFQLGFKPSAAAVPNPLPGVLPGCFSLNSPMNPPVTLTGLVNTTLRYEPSSFSTFLAIYFGLTVVALFKQGRPFSFSLRPILRVFFRQVWNLTFLVFNTAHPRYFLYLWSTLSVAHLTGPLQVISQAWLNATFPIIVGLVYFGESRGSCMKY